MRRGRCGGDGLDPSTTQDCGWTRGGSGVSEPRRLGRGRGGRPGGVESGDCGKLQRKGAGAAGLLTAARAAGPRSGDRVAGSNRSRGGRRGSGWIARSTSAVREYSRSRSRPFGITAVRVHSRRCHNRPVSDPRLAPGCSSKASISARATSPRSSTCGGAGSSFPRRGRGIPARRSGEFRTERPGRIAMTLGRVNVP